MKYYDFIIVLESKQRELDAYCLIKYELERRGYSVLLTSQTDIRWIRKPIYEASVIIVNVLGSNAWNDGNIRRFVNFKKVIEMRFEQIRIDHDYEEEVVNDYWRVESLAKDCVSITWGPDSSKFAREIFHYREEQIKEIGYIATDFCRPEFSGYYKDRDLIAQEYGLDSSKRWNLFIASFLGLDPSKREIPDSYFKRADEIYWQAQQEILDWMESGARNHPEQLFIYRPHPNENRCEKLNHLEQQYDNFFVITEDALRQWIMVADVLYTFYTTGIFELYLSSKNVYILRPFDIPEEFDMPMYLGGQFETTVDDYEKTLQKIDKSRTFPLSMEYLNRTYRIDEGFVYKRLADVCEKVFSDSKYNIRPENMKEFRDYQKELYKHVGIRDKLKESKHLYSLYKWLVFHTVLGTKEKREEWLDGLRWSVSQNEVKEIQARIKKALEEG